MNFKKWIDICFIICYNKDVLKIQYLENKMDVEIKQRERAAWIKKNF